MQALEQMRSSVGRAFVLPSSRDGVRSGRGGRTRAAATVLVAVGLFTVSWERLGNISIGPYNVKLPALVLSVAAVLVLPAAARVLRSLPARPSAGRWLAVLSAAVLVLFAARAVTSFPLGPGIAQLAAVVSGALLPAVAFIGVVRRRDDVVWALRWLVSGAIVAGLYGIYQLVAFYLGLPQGIVYTGVGTSGEGGRISSFSYEPAYFAYFLVLVCGAVITIARLQDRAVRWSAIAFFAVVLTLANVRALLFVLPLVGVLLAVAWRRNRRVLLRSVVVGAVVVVLSTAVPVVVSALVASQQQAEVEQQEPANPTRTIGPHASEPVSPPARSSSPDSAPPVAAPQLPTDVLDPNEQSSNAPRLDLYKAVAAVDLAAPLLGVGPGHLRDALAEDGYVAPNQGATVVANNIWLQAAADGGIPLLLLELGVVASMAVIWWRARWSAAQALLSTWLGVVLIGGLLTSYYFDIKIWVVGTLGALLFAVDEHRPRRTRAAD